MANENILDFTDLRNLPMYIALGSANPNSAFKIDKFARCEIPNNKLVPIASFINVVDATVFKPFNDSLEDLFLVSDNIADTHTITIYYINGDRDAKEAEVTLTGTTPINLATELSDTIHCIWRMKNLSAVDNVGLITVTNAGTQIFCNMPATSGINANSSLTSIYSVPRGYVALIIYASLILDKGADAKGAMFARREGGVFTYEKALASYQSQSDYQNLFLVADEKTDICPIAFAQTGGIAYLDYQILVLKRDLIGQNFKV